MEKVNEIIEFLRVHPMSSRADIEAGLMHEVSSSKCKRLLSEAIDRGMIEPQGVGRGTKYVLTPQAHLLMELNMDEYFSREVDERIVCEKYNFELIDHLLPSVALFSGKELDYLNALQQEFRQNIDNLSREEYDREMERLAIDLSWKSSQIEGNTYSLLETERLLREREEAKGKSREEAVMLLNHKDALKFILGEPEYLNPLSVRRIEDIHSILVSGLGVERNLRRHRVGITGTNYRPLDNEFQIREAMQGMCDLINGKDEVFEKALLALLLLSYIQPFTDGNKRTARIVSNAILMSKGYCPLSFRTVESIDYKKAMLMFYEQNNISAFKRIFIGQFEFAVKTYF